MIPAPLAGQIEQLAADVANLAHDLDTTNQQLRDTRETLRRRTDTAHFLEIRLQLTADALRIAHRTTGHTWRNTGSATWPNNQECLCGAVGRYDRATGQVDEVTQ